MKRVILSDFDGTITTMDITDTMCREAIPERWAEVEEMWLAGEINHVTCYELEFEALGYTQADIDAFLERVTISPGTERLVRAAQERGWEFHVLSAGFDYFIERVLHQRGLPVPYTANTMRFDGGGLPQLQFLDTTLPGCTRFLPPCAGCKPVVWREWKGRGYQVAYLGDGSTDFCLADTFRAEAEPGDLLFATGSLLRYCRENDIPAVPFEALDDVADHLIDGGWGEAREAQTPGV